MPSVHQNATQISPHYNPARKAEIYPTCLQAFKTKPTLRREAASLKDEPEEDFESDIEEEKGQHDVLVKHNANKRK